MYAKVLKASVLISETRCILHFVSKAWSTKYVLLINCFVNGGQWRLVTFGLGSAAESKSKYIHGVTEKSAFILTGNSTHQFQQLF
jgi:hypothetical protein